jgi:large subunit ribosomal protein L25
MATSQRPSLAVRERSERGSRASRRLRREGLVPGILYGGSHDEPVAFTVGHHEFRLLLNQGATLFDVQIEGEKSVPVIIKDQQLHPVRDETLHVDLLEVRLDEKIHAEVTIELVGAEDAPGVDAGGVLDQPTREIGIEALPTDIPEQIVVDVSGLEMNSTLTLAEVVVPPNVTLLDENPEEITIASVVPPTKVEEPEIEEETELVGEDGEPLAEGEEPAEGAEEGAGEGEGDSGGGDDSGDE